jgi:hypothetical protein
MASVSNSAPNSYSVSIASGKPRIAAYDIGDVMVEHDPVCRRVLMFGFAPCCNSHLSRTGWLMAQLYIFYQFRCVLKSENLYGLYGRVFRGRGIDVPAVFDEGGEDGGVCACDGLVEYGLCEACARAYQEFDGWDGRMRHR